MSGARPCEGIARNPGAPDIGGYLASEASRLLDACTRCGRCAEVCPVIPAEERAGDAPQALAHNLAQHLAGTHALADATAAWLHSCNGCGACIPACPEGVNPRKLLLHAAIAEAPQSTRTPQLFRRMARAVKLMSAMQLVPEDYRRLLVPPRQRPAELVFYTGCNALRTPHLLFNVMLVLDALEADYEVLGGPSSCCGVIATKWEGEQKVGGRFTANTIARFESFEPRKVLNWCPTCQIHLDETMGGFVPRGYDFDHITDYLLARADELRARFIQSVPLRVVLHAHQGVPEVGRNVQALLAAIPGLEVVETVWESAYTCGGSGCSKAPALRDREHAELIERVRAQRADALVTLYHGCHMAFLPAARTGEFAVLNFTDLLAQALGRAPHEDRLQQFSLTNEWQAIVREARPYLEANGLDIDPAWLAAHGPEIFSVAEFRGGLDCLAQDPPAPQGAPA